MFQKFFSTRFLLLFTNFVFDSGKKSENDKSKKPGGAVFNAKSCCGLAGIFPSYKLKQREKSVPYIRRLI